MGLGLLMGVAEDYHIGSFPWQLRGWDPKRDAYAVLCCNLPCFARCIAMEIQSSIPSQAIQSGRDTRRAYSPEFGA
jgi:hypothetical protein